MTRVLLTGMSGTGKSTVIAALAERGYTAVDADEDGFSELVRVPDDEPTGLEPGSDWVWRPGRVRALLAEPGAGPLFLAGCSPNQGEFYPAFDRIVLLTAPPALIIDRLTTRTNNPYGKRPGEIERVLGLIETVEPLLRRGAGHVIDTSAPLARVVAEVLRIANEPSS